MSIAELFYAKQAHRAQRYPGRRRPPHRVRRRRMVFEPLEPRLVLSSHPLSYAAGGAALDLTLRLEQEVDGTNVLRLIDDAAAPGAQVVASQPLAETSAVVITGSDQADSLTVDLTLPFAVPISFTDAATGDGDTLQVIGGDQTWNITGADAGTVADVTFTGIENLVGAPDNQDTFVFDFAAGAGLSGHLEGGAGGFDSLVLDGGTFATVLFSPSGPDSGTIDLDGTIISYSGLEPTVLGGAVTDLTLNLTGSADTATLEDDPTYGLKLVSDNGTFEDTFFGIPTGSLTINAHRR